MPASSFAPSLVRAALALVVTLLALGGALLGAALLATGALLAWGARVMGIGRSVPATARASARGAREQGVIEGEYRVIESDSSRTP